MTIRRVALSLAFGLCVLLASAQQHVLAQTPATLDATIFKYDGHDFVRVNTTLNAGDGKAAVNTKLDRDTAAYRALVKKRSYSGNVVLFGRKYEAHYAPLTGEDGRLTGAIFVAVPQ